MKSIVCALLIAACTEAAIVFKNSYLIDETDLKSNDKGYAFACPGQGCTVYTTKMAAGDVGIYDSATLVATLDAIYIKENGFLTGHHLNAGNNYKLMKTGAGDMNSVVKVYIVADIAGAGAVTDFDSVTTDIDISGSGKKIVTVLNTYSSGVTFSGYKGTNAPKIYSSGFDSVGSCKAIYTASSVDNAAASKIGIVSALTTIDFGSADASNKYHAAKYVATANTVAIGQSAIVMSPGYTGCTIDHNYNDFAMASYDFKSGSENTKAWINFGDVSISQGHELTVKVTGQNDLKISGSTAQNYAYVADNIDVNVSWDQKGQNDFFFAQIDFTNGVAHVFGLSTLIALIAALLSATNGFDRRERCCHVARLQGVPINHNYNDASMISYHFKAEDEANINFGDMDIAEGHKRTLRVTGQADMKIGGWSAQSYSFVANNVEVTIEWDQKQQSDYFLFRTFFGVSTIMAIHAALT